MILLPGTKNTMRDLLWMRQNGLEAAVQKAHRAGAIVFGICGGYQMLGRAFRTPGVEEGGELRVDGLRAHAAPSLPGAKGTRTRVTGQVQPLPGPLAGLSGLPVEGYEIHMGVSTAGGEQQPATRLTDAVTGTEKSEGGALAAGVYGSYVHGFFDRPEIAREIARSLAARKGLDYDAEPGMDYQAYKETQYDLLADTLRRHLDMEQIYRNFGRRVINPVKIEHGSSASQGY